MIACPECQQHYKNERGVSAHRSQIHGFRLERRAPSEATLSCPECQQGCRTVRGLAYHRSVKHGIRPVTPPRAVTPGPDAQPASSSRTEVLTGSPEGRAALAALLRRIETNERIEGYDDLVAGGARLREASHGQPSVGLSVA